ncbi:RagB/SusD family nutrient uptake outer membrane protein [Puia sp. P3]|uniref:RagB/SusD family nutrient uptake outer membrane protein n=1 Tax=Puia sp. P3 TaxID=3423952 RepID=UPI003D66D3A0
MYRRTWRTSSTRSDLRSQIYFGAIPSFLQQWISPLFVGQKRDPAVTGGIGNSVIGCSFRSSEAYLNRAEAYAQKYLATGDASAAQSALSDLNALRVKRYDPSAYQPLGSMTADSLLRFCRNERRRELFSEGHRWFDLRRYGMPSITHYYSPIAGTVQKYVLNGHDPQYTLQIPPTALLLNPNLSQNPAGPARNPSN